MDIQENANVALEAYHELRPSTIWGAFRLSFALLVIYRLGLLIYRLYFHPLAKVPGPMLMAATRLPYQMESCFLGTWHSTCIELHRQYGPMVRVAPDTILMDGSIGWKQVFGHQGKGKTEFIKLPGFYFKGADKALVSGPTDVHRHQRRVIAPAFSESAVYEQEPIVTSYVRLLVKKMEEFGSGDQPLDITHWFHLTTFDIVGDLCFGESFGTLESNDTSVWADFIGTAFKFAGFRRFCRVYPFLYPILAVVMASVLLKDSNQLKYGTEKAQRRMALGAKPKNGRRDLITHMLQPTSSGHLPLSEEVMILNSGSLSVAGSDTTATALSGLFFYLGQDETRLRILKEEIRDAFASIDEVNMKELTKLPYLQACIDEILRLYPPATVTPSRMSPGAEVEGVYMPYGSAALVSIWATNQNPKHFREPASFRPERWLEPDHPLYDDRFSDDNKAMAGAFSHGPRDCVGKKLALSEMRLIITSILLKWDFDLEKGQDDWHKTQTTTILWEKRPLYIHLRERADKKKLS